MDESGPSRARASEPDPTPPPTDATPARRGVEATAAPAVDPASEEARRYHDRAFAVVDALERIAALHERGLLTADEHTRAKEIVLSPEHGEPPARPLVAVDFDGVLHAYTSGWKGPTTIVDPPVEGAIEWLIEMDQHYDLAVTSVRNAYSGAAAAMRAWLGKHGLPPAILARVKFPAGTPDAAMFLDDRGYRFEGRFPRFDELDDLEPWYRK